MPTAQCATIQRAYLLTTEQATRRSEIITGMKRIGIGPPPLADPRAGWLGALNENTGSFAARSNIERVSRSHSNIDSGCKRLSGPSPIISFNEPRQGQGVRIQRYSVRSVDDTFEAIVAGLIGAHGLDSIQNDDNSRDTCLGRLPDAIVVWRPGTLVLRDFRHLLPGTVASLVRPVVGLPILNSEG